MAETAKTKKTSPSKKLFIVESPAKAKTLNKFLGKDFTVKASVGHIRDLPKRGRGKNALGIDIENGFQPHYEIIPGKEKTVKELKDAAKKADAIYLAPDPDREGEAIAWHLKELIGLNDDQVLRVTFSAITKRAVTEAMKHPRMLNMDLVNAQQGRRILDRLVGFNLSPFLWKKIAKNLSAGRVQSVAVRLVVEREREISAFKPVGYWRIIAEVFPEGKKKDLFSAELVNWRGEKFAVGKAATIEKEAADAILNSLKKATFTVSSINKRETKRRPLAPFITSTLQQAASNALGYGPSRTMGIAQKLYEGVALGDEGHTGLITYMRTDSVRVEPEAINEVRDFIKETFDSPYLPEKPNFYGSSEKAQDAHEAIRPTSVLHTPEKVKPHLDPSAFRLYELIWKRFVASQMAEAKYATTTISITAAEGIFEAKGRIVLFDGFTVLTGDYSEKKEKNGETEQQAGFQKLPLVQEDDTLTSNEIAASEHFTKPPPRYSEASLVKALEKEGIGRPSTYAPTIQTIKDRGYVLLEKRSFHASELGMAVTDMLVKNFSEIMEYQFTAEMENDLDKIEHGKVDWVELLNRFYSDFSVKVEKALVDAEPLKGRPYEGEEKCPLCKSDLLIRYSRNGAFLGCSKYPECKGLLPMPEEGKGSSEEEEAPECDECGRPMTLKVSRFGKKFYACTGYPECKTTKSYGGEEELPKIERDCDKCGKPMAVKMGKRGAFLACSGYPECTNTLPIKDGKVIELPTVEGEVCEKCGREMAVKMGRRGPFLACTGYPKCKNAKPLKSDKSKS